MPAIFHNRFVQFIIGFVGVAVVLFIILTILASLNSARNSVGLSVDYDYAPSAPGMGRGVADSMMMESAGMPAMDSSYMPYPTPTPGGYTAELERYETTDYSVSGRTKHLGTICNSLNALKADSRFHFKSLNESLNNCNAVFYTEEEYASSLVSQFLEFDDITITRSTNSVTRHREQLQGQASIIEQQLASVNRSLATAETEFDEIARFARENNDAATLSNAIEEKLRLIDNLTSRKISLTSQLDSLYQRSADLEERIGVVQFSINVNRSQAINPGETSRKWERAWDDLGENFTDTLIGITAFFGIFLLWAVRITLYLLIVLIIIRGLWKFVKFIWRF